MDIKRIKVAFAGLLETLLKIDPTTGLPYTDPYQEGDTTRAYAQAPFSLPESDLPLWVIFTGPAVYPGPRYQTEERLAREDRDFILCLYAAIAQSGIDGEAERVVEPYLEPARKLIQSHPLIYNGDISRIVPGIMQVYLLRDEGVVTLAYGATNPVKYDGLRFTVRVEGENEVEFNNE